MGTLRGKLIDRNRYSKRYPLIRAPKRLSYLGDADLEIEVGTIYFDATDVGTLTYDAQFVDTSYQIAASVRDSGDEGGVDVNIYISAKAQNSVTVRSSAVFTGYVDIFAVRVGS